MRRDTGPTSTLPETVAVSPPDPFQNPSLRPPDPSRPHDRHAGKHQRPRSTPDNGDAQVPHRPQIRVSNRPHIDGGAVLQRHPVEPERGCPSRVCSSPGRAKSRPAPPQSADAARRCPDCHPRPSPRCRGGRCPACSSRSSRPVGRRAPSRPGTPLPQTPNSSASVPHTSPRRGLASWSRTPWPQADPDRLKPSVAPVGSTKKASSLTAPRSMTSDR